MFLSGRPHSGLTPAFLTIVAHFAMSARRKAANCCGVLVTGSIARLRIDWWTSSRAITLRTSPAILATIAGGVPAGTKNPHHGATSKPGSVSDTVGVVGMAGERSLPVMANRRSLPDLGRGTGRNKKSPPGRHFEAGQRFGYCRGGRHGRRAFFARHGQQAQLARFNQGHGRQRTDEQILHVAADGVGQRESGTLVRYVLRRYAGHALEQLARQMVGTAGAGGGV